jgi:hypothetical protein
MKKYLVILFMCVAFWSCGQNVPATIGTVKLKDVAQKNVPSKTDVLLGAQGSEFWRRFTFGDAQKFFAPYVAQNSLNYVPTPTGNTLNLNVIFTSSADGKKYYIDPSGNSFVLSDGSQGKTYLAGQGITITNSNVINAKDTSATNELQVLSKIGNVVSLSKNGGSFTLPSANNLQQVTDVGNTTTNNMLIANSQYSLNLQSEKIGFGITSAGAATFLAADANLTTSNTLKLPTSTGTLVVSVNGEVPNAAGNVSISINDTHIGNTDLSLTSNRTLDLGGKYFGILDNDPNLASEFEIKTDMLTIKSNSVVNNSNGIVRIGVDSSEHELQFLTGQGIDPTGKFVAGVNAQGKVHFVDAPQSSNLANSDLTQNALNRAYNTEKGNLTFMSSNNVNNLAAGRVSLRTKTVDIYPQAQSATDQTTVNLGVSNPNSQLRINDGTVFDFLGNFASDPTGKFLKAVDNTGKAIWDIIPTPPSGISAVTANEGLTSSILNGNPNIQLGGNPLAVGITNERGFNMGGAGSLVLRDIQIPTTNPLRDVLVVTNDNNPIVNDDGHRVGIKYDISGNVSRLSSSEERFDLTSKKEILLENQSGGINGAGSQIVLQDNSLVMVSKNASGNTTSQLQIGNNNVGSLNYASRNDPGITTYIAGFDTNGNFRSDLVGELPFQTPLTAGTGIGIVGGVISNTGDNSSANELQTLSINGSNLSISGGNTIDIQQPPSNPYKYSTYFDDFYGFKENLSNGNIGQLDWKITTNGGGVVGNANFTSNNTFVFDNSAGYLEMKSGSNANGFSRIEMPIMRYRNANTADPRIGDKFRCRIVIDNLTTNLSLTDVLIGYKIPDGFGGFWGLWATNGTLNATNTNGSVGMQSSTLLGGVLFPSGQTNNAYDIELYTETTGTNTKAFCYVNGVKRGEMFCGGVPDAYPTIEFKSTASNTDPNKRILLDYFNLNLSNPVVR